jgi:poly(A) polymerase
MLISVGNPKKRFEEDYLRIMRGFRFAFKYNMILGLETQEAMMDNMNGLKEIAPERILEELLKIFSVPNRVRSFNLMSEFWKSVIPEVFALRGCEQGSNWHSEGDVFVHTSLVIGNLEDMNVQDPIVYIAAVLHDIGKPQTAIRKSPTSVSFHGHEKIGADMAKGILSRMKFSKKDSDKILFVIEKHMIMHKFLDMRKSKQKRLFHEEHFDALWKVSQADSRGAIADSDERNEEKERILESIQKRIDEFDAYEEPLVSGLDLISLGMKPGPSFREILNTVYDAQLEGEQSKDVLIELVKSM